MGTHLIDGHPIREVNGTILHVLDRTTWAYTSTTGTVTLFKDEAGVYGYATKGRGPLPIVSAHRWWSLSEVLAAAQVDYPLARQGEAWTNDPDRTTRRETW